jgi:hypothetical protein
VTLDGLAFIRAAAREKLPRLAAARKVLQVTTSIVPFTTVFIFLLPNQINQKSVFGIYKHGAASLENEHPTIRMM